MPFIDRERELEALEERWGLEPQLILLWGRRRIGKTTLIQRFAVAKPGIVYQAIQGTAAEQLTLLTDRILAYRPDPALAASPLQNWPQALAYLTNLARLAAARREPLLVVIDEFPYLVASTPALPSMLQATLEEVRRDGLPLFLVIAGSQVAMFERHVLHGPLFGRRTWGEQLPPLDHRQARGFFPDWTAADALRAWAVLGGVPYYLEQFDPGRSLAWNLENRILRKGEVLYSEAELVVSEELGPDARTYLSILAAVASGASRQNEIATRVGIPGHAVPPYLATLRRLHLLEHDRPTGGGKGGRAGVWRLGDPYLRFWFRFVRPNLADLEARRHREVFRQRVAPELDRFVSKPAFEEACRSYVRLAMGRDAALPERGVVGAWWGQVPDERRSGGRRTRKGEVDVVVYDGERLLLAGEAKWSAGEVDVDALGQLEATARHLPGFGPETRLLLVGREGFSARLRQIEEAGRVILRTVDDLYR
ncbi:MAG: ATPase AAA [Chloroflexota bacterium]|nr:MAG: ATPase AAA [Chloroflexota bacterium]